MTKSPFFRSEFSADHKRCARFSKAFSLVEVVLALGVFSFAVIPLCGLIPLCLSTSKDAAEYSRRAQIVQQIVNSMQQTSFDKLPAAGSPFTSSFSYEGGPVASGNPAYFMVRGIVASNTSLPGALPSGGLATLRVEISTPDQRTNHYFAVLADTGK